MRIDILNLNKNEDVISFDDHRNVRFLWNGNCC